MSFLRGLGSLIRWAGGRLAAIGTAIERHGQCWYCGDFCRDRWCHICQRTQGYTRPSVWTW